MINHQNSCDTSVVQVAITDISDKCKMFLLAGAGSHAVLEELGAGDVIRAPRLTHSLFNQGGKPVIVASGSGLAVEGYTIIVDEAGAAELWKTLLAKVGSMMDINLALVCPWW